MRSALRSVALSSLLMACGGEPTLDAGTDTPSDAFVAPPPSILLPEGEVMGQRDPDGVSYLGIPYAEAPVGPLRFAPPVPRAPWTEPVQPTLPGCPQTALGLAGGDEDCLVVHVHVPNDLPADAPVIVWIHGGAFLVGSGQSIDRSTLGDRLARDQRAIVVSMNYRLGPFGFLTYPGLGAGNQGFLDQQLALRWVRDHIALFGGDPEDVTLVGESAGGLSVCLHMVAPGSRDLFARVISESGLCDGSLPSAEDAAASGVALVEAVGCADASDVAGCMREASVDALFEAAGDAADLTVLLSGTSNRPFWASLDGTVIPGTFRDVVMAGEHANVPAIFGWNRDEGTLFVGLAEQAGTVADAAAYDRSITDFAAREGLDEAVLRAAYPITNYPDPGAAIADLVGHAELICPSRRAALLLAEAGNDVRVYRFDFPDARFQLGLGRDLGAFHSAEIQFVFGYQVGGRPFNGSALALHERMQGAWGAFARGEDPSDALEVAWPMFAASDEASVILDATITSGSALDRDACALWDAAASD
jgi:para-nitrobenzyl esterase